MRKDLLIIALGLSLIAVRSGAEALAMPDGAPQAAIDRASLPTKGTSMADVEKKLGAPSARQPTVGGDTAKHPPITRWDYPGFSIIFEKDKVIDAVIPGAPPPIRHQDQLQSAGTSAPPMPASPVAAPEAAPAAAPAPEAPAAAGSMDAQPPTSGPETQVPIATPDNPNPDAPKQ